jgi:ParB-like nuclease domain
MQRQSSIIKEFAAGLHESKALIVMMNYTPHYAERQEALSQFAKAKRRAKRHLFRARISRKSGHLICFGDFRFQAHGFKSLEDIPLANIKGSLGRCQDFSHDFLPRHGGLEERWTQVWRLMHGMKTLPPIEVYELNETYYVIDGHHRVSVAKQLGLRHIEALVSKLKELPNVYE